MSTIFKLDIFHTHQVVDYYVWSNLQFICYIRIFFGNIWCFGLVFDRLKRLMMLIFIVLTGIPLMKITSSQGKLGIVSFNLCVSGRTGSFWYILYNCTWAMLLRSVTLNVSECQTWHDKIWHVIFKSKEGVEVT